MDYQIGQFERPNFSLTYVREIYNFDDVLETALLLHNYKRVTKFVVGYSMHSMP